MLAKLFIFGFFLLKMAFWNKKKDENKSEQKLDNYELPELPSIQDFSKDGLTQDFGFSGMNAEKDKPDVSELPELPEIYTPAATKIASSPIAGKKMTSEVSSSTVYSPVSEEVEETAKASKIKGPVYIKIDKFKDALANFEIVKRKIKEVEGLLRKIRELRAKEQEELGMWEKELEDVKIKLASIDEKIFSRFD